MNTPDIDDRNLAAEIISLVNATDFLFTDLMIEEDERIMAKTPGGWKEVDALLPATKEDIAAVFAQLNPDWEAILKSGRALNRAILLSEYRLRMNGYQACGGDKYMLSVRRVLRHPLSLRDIGLDSLPIMIDNAKGIVLVNGRTGSGKSTTVAALVDYINTNKRVHIVTIEDPIEYQFTRKQSVFSPREIGHDVNSFAEGVRDAMRQCPDVIIIGEIRDRDTAEQALLAAESGALVIATLHANSTAGSIQKLLSFFTADEREAKKESLAHALLGIVSQNLLPTSDGRGWVLAAELLFNHKQQVTAKIGNATQITNYLEQNEDKLSRTMHDALVALVKEKKVNKIDAVLSLSGLAQEKLRAALKD